MEPELTRHRMSEAGRSAVLQRAAAALAELDGIRAAWAHGSFVRGEAFRDIDIGVWFERRPEWYEPGRVARHIWEATGRPLFEVDVQPLNEAAPAFRVAVAHSGRVLFERDPGDAADLLAMARSELIDLREWQRIHGVA